MFKANATRFFSGSSQLLNQPSRNALLWNVNRWGWGCLLRVATLSRRTWARKKRVIAITGTYGKTTTTRAVTAALGMPLHPWTDLNANCFASVPAILLRQLWHSRQAVVEVGINGPSQMQRYARALRPDVVVVTCIGSEHIQAFRDVVHLRSEKAELVRVLRPDGVAVLNGDDPQVRWMTTQTHARVVTFGRDPRNDVSAENIKVEWPYGTRFTLCTPRESHELRVQLIGEQMVYPVLAAAAVALTEGQTLPDINMALQEVTPTPGRLQPVILPSGVAILRDDYKATVETVHQALTVLGRLPAKRRIVVLGDLDAPPPPERPYYRAVGDHVAQVAAKVILVGNKFKSYRVGLRRGGMSDQQISHAKSIRDAIRIVGDEVAPGDVVLVKGREIQKLTRIVLALSGTAIRCHIERCPLHFTLCDRCAMLTRGWHLPSPQHHPSGLDI